MQEPAAQGPVSRLSTAPRQEIIRLNTALLHGHAAWRARGKWTGTFNVAAWLRFPDGLSDMVQFMLSYRDQERRKTCVIDRCLPNRQTLILMNGVVELAVAGEVTDMSLCLSGPGEDVAWMLDEYHIEPSQAAQLESRRSIKTTA